MLRKILVVGACFSRDALVPTLRVGMHTYISEGRSSTLAQTNIILIKFNALFIAAKAGSYGQVLRKILVVGACFSRDALVPTLRVGMHTYVSEGTSTKLAQTNIDTDQVQRTIHRG